jgi:hypothetical protein
VEERRPSVLTFDPNSISQGELHALKDAAEKAWGDDTRHPDFSGDDDESRGQCYVTSYWLSRHFGGYIGDDDGHYVWVSPDKKYVIDLTGDKHRYIIYKSKSHPLYRGMDVFNPKPTKRAELFADRAEKIFRNLDHFAKVSMDYAGDGLPAEEPQATADRERRLDVTHDRIEPKQLNFAYANGKIILDDKPLEELVDANTSGPIALGTVDIDPDDYATWTVKTNIGLNGLRDVLETYCNSVGLTCVEVADMDGNKISRSISQLSFVRKDGELFISHKQDWSKIASNMSGAFTVGSFRILGDNIELPNRAYDVELLQSLKEFASDHGLNFVLAGNDNVLKRIEDLELDNYSNPDPTNGDGQFFNDAPQDENAIAGQENGAVGLSGPERINGLYKCPQCESLLPSWHEYVKHRRNEGETIMQNDHFPNTDPDATFPPHFSPRQPQGVGEVVFTSSVEALPIPFVYDVEDDSIVVGDPGMQVSELAAGTDYESTVQGIYEKGKLLLKSTTTIPYTVRHLIRLWYYQHPELEVKSVELKTPDGNTTKLASAGNLVFISSLNDAKIERLASSLLREGAEIFAVGRALEDAKEGKLPHLTTLKVAHVDKKFVYRALQDLGGHVSMAGYDEGQFVWSSYDGEGKIKIAVVKNANEVTEDRVDLRDGRYEQAI